MSAPPSRELNNHQKHPLRMPNTAQVELNDLQKQVDAQIEARLQRICFSEWKSHSFEKNGKRKKRPGPMSYSCVVTDLLQLRQCLYNGAAPQDVSAAMMQGEIAYIFLKST